MPGFVVKRVPGIVVVGREHVVGLDAAGEVVMAVEIPVAADLNEPGTTAGATGHVAGDGDHSATGMLPAFADGAIGARLPGLTIEGIAGRVAIGVEGLVDGLIIGPTGTAYHIGQQTLTVGRDDGHAKVMMQVIWHGVQPVGRDLQIARGPAAIGRIAVIVQRAEDQVARPAAAPVETVPSGVNGAAVGADNGGTRAGYVLACLVIEKDSPHSREGIRSVPGTRRLPALPGRSDHAVSAAPLCKRGSSAELLIGVDGAAHASRAPMLHNDAGAGIHRVFNDRLRGCEQRWIPGVRERNQVDQVDATQYTKKDANRG